MSNKVFLSGVQPSGKPHIGNYFGAMKQFVDFQNKYSGYAMIVDYHALHSIRNKEEMSTNIKAVLLDYLAIGLNPEKTTIFKQSDISEHTELTWIFDTIVTMPYLMRAHAYKDAEAKNKEIDVGTFNYPVLMAADILLYSPDIVPVGADQKQHVEIARDIAEKFNRIYGETFKLPEAMIIKEVAVVPGTDGRKMSKSYNNTIPLFAEYEEIKKCVMGIVTDSGMTREGAIKESIATGQTVIRSVPFAKNLYAIHKLFKKETELNELFDFYMAHENNYKTLKELLIEDLEKFIAPLREKRKELEKDMPKALAILKAGGEKAKKVAEIKMDEVREKIGVDVY